MREVKKQIPSELKNSSKESRIKRNISATPGKAGKTYSKATASAA